jgi:hypothetical protein
MWMDCLLLVLLLVVLVLVLVLHSIHSIVLVLELSTVSLVLAIVLAGAEEIATMLLEVPAIQVQVRGSILWLVLVSIYLSRQEEEVNDL